MLLTAVLVALAAFHLWMVQRGIDSGAIHFGRIEVARKTNPNGFWIILIGYAAFATLCLFAGAFAAVGMIRF